MPDSKWVHPKGYSATIHIAGLITRPRVVLAGMLIKYCAGKLLQVMVIMMVVEQDALGV